MQAGHALYENIALLSRFTKYIDEPTTNQPPWGIAEKDTMGSERQLTVEEEKRTAQVFALLLSTNDDPNRIGAVCIQETHETGSFIVRTATNSGSQDQRKATFSRLINAARLEASLSITVFLFFGY